MIRTENVFFLYFSVCIFFLEVRASNILVKKMTVRRICVLAFQRCIRDVCSLILSWSLDDLFLQKANLEQRSL